MGERYPLKPFRIHNQDSLLAIIHHYPLATIVTGHAGSAEMTLLPLLARVDGEGRLFLDGHLDRNNPQALQLAPNSGVSFLFKGPDSYAAPDLYPGPQLPGWLYVAVKGNGRVVAEIAGAELCDLLVRATRIFGGSQQRFQLDPDDPRVACFLPDILGFSIAVTDLSGIAKLAQDKGAEDAGRAASFLLSQSNAASTELFQRLLDETV